MHGYKPENPLIVQSDKTVLLEVDNDQYADARDALARFAELEKARNTFTPTASRRSRFGTPPPPG